MGTPKELTFDNEGIQQLAKDVGFLLNEITTQNDSNKGNMPDFQTAADISSDLSALEGDGTKAYCTAYSKEFAAVQKLYTTLQTQLQTLQTMLSQTGTGYQQREGQNKQTVAKTNPDAGPLAST